MVFYVLGALSVLTFGLCTAEKLTLPIATCKRGMPKYHTCLKNALQEALPRLLEGLPEFDFPKLDPLLYEHLTNVYDADGIHGEIHADNVLIYGMKNLSFRRLKTHFADNTFNLIIDMRIPRVIAIGDIKAKGNFFGIGINLQGYFNMTAEDVKATCDYIGRVVNDTWIIEHSRAISSIERLKVNITDPTQANQDFNDFISSFVNNYWPPMYRAVIPTVSESLDKFITDISNIIFSKVSFSAVFP